MYTYICKTASQRLCSIPDQSQPIRDTALHSLSIHMVILPRTFTLTEAILCTASKSYVHALILTWGPICPFIGCTQYISANTNNARATHNAWEYILSHILHYHLLIKVLVISAILSIL